MSYIIGYRISSNGVNKNSRRISRTLSLLRSYSRVKNAFVQHECSADGRIGYIVISDKIILAEREVFFSNPLHDEKYISHPSDLSRISNEVPPFAYLALKKKEGDIEKIECGTDYLGLGRAYFIKGSEVDVFSNHIGLGTIVSNSKLEADELSIRYFVGLGWFPYERTPYKNIERLSPGSRVRFSDGHCGVFDRYCTLKHVIRDGVGQTDADRRRQVIDGIQEAFSLAAHKYTEDQMQVALSGGNDSRLVAASAIEFGIQPNFLTIGTLKGEVEIAERLLKVAGHQDRHLVTYPKKNQINELNEDSTAIQRNIADYFWFADGDYTLNKLRKGRHAANYSDTLVRFQGGGGESLRGSHYPTLEKLAAVRSYDTPFRSIRNGMLNAYAMHDETRLVLMSYFSESRDRAWELGADTPERELDFWHLMEKSRRWGPAGFNNIVAPFFSQKVVSVALNLAPSEALSGSFFHSCVAEAVPGWRGIPTYKSDAIDEKVFNTLGLRAWQNKLLPNIIFDLTKRFDAYFDPAEVQAVFQNCKREQSVVENRADALFQRIFWLSGLNEHINSLNELVENYENGATVVSSIQV